MITLTPNPPQVTTVLGAAGKVVYDKLVLTQIVYDTKRGTINGLLEVTAPLSLDSPAIPGRWTIGIGGQVLEVDIERLNYFQRVKLDAGAQAVVASYIANAQNAIEQGMLALGALAGTQKSGI